jgi:hypothetical protein
MKILTNRKFQAAVLAATLLIGGIGCEAQKTNSPDTAEQVQVSGGTTQRPVYGTPEYDAQADEFFAKKDKVDERIAKNGEVIQTVTWGELSDAERDFIASKFGKLGQEEGKTVQVPYASETKELKVRVNLEGIKIQTILLDDQEVVILYAPKPEPLPGYQPVFDMGEALKVVRNTQIGPIAALMKSDPLVHVMFID